LFYGAMNDSDTSGLGAYSLYIFTKVYDE